METTHLDWFCLQLFGQLRYGLNTMLVDGHGAFLQLAVAIQDIL
jgi:hypothetical protein